jgi:glycosyltransferase involved in cell wall biosynthesis
MIGAPTPQKVKPMSKAFIRNEAISGALARKPETPNTRVSVLMFDLLPSVPYYTGHLCTSLNGIGNLQVTLASATYPHDSGYFQRTGLRTRPGLFDIAYRLRFSPARRAVKLAEYLLNLTATALRLLKSKPSVLHVQFTPLAECGLPFELWFLKIARGLGIKVVGTVHNVVPHDGSKGLTSTYSRLYSLMHSFICHNLPAKDRLASEFGIDPARIAVVPHGPLFGTHKAERASRVVVPGDKTVASCMVLWQGIVRPYKGISFLLKVWKIARQRGMQGTLWIVGTGNKSLRKEIEQEAAVLGIGSSVQFIWRFVSVEELENYYQAADIIVYPYSAITTSGALMTGIGYGKAILASDLPAFRQELQHERTALLAPYGEVEGWASALLRLASNPDLRAALAEELNVVRPARPSWEEIALQTYRVYERLLPPAESQIQAARVRDGSLHGCYTANSR